MALSIHPTRQQVCSFNYSVLLCLMAIAMPTSNFFMNLWWVLLLANWLVEGDFGAKLARFRSSYLLHAVLVLFGMHLVGMLWSEDMAYGFNDIRKKLPLLAVPVVLLTSERLSRFRWTHLQVIYVFTVVIVSIIGLIRHLVIPDLPYRDIIPWISHIRFSLNVVFVICILMYRFRDADACFSHYVEGFNRTRAFLGKAPLQSVSLPRRFSAVYRAADMLMVLFLLFFLLLQQSYTGVVVLGAIVIVAAFWSRNLKAVLSVVAAMMLVGGVVGYHVYDYYHLRSLSVEPLQECTANGNPYVHEQNGFIECGGYVHNYLCYEELYREWPKHSSMSLDSVSEVGFAIDKALIRYLNCLNLPKDSLGVSLLSPADVALIEKGVGNPHYAQQGSLNKFFDQLLFEFENARHNGDIRGFTMLERFELWANGWQCILQQPWFGVGTGDLVNVEHARLAEIDSSIADTSKHIHNQYLTLILAFGFVGFAVIVFFFARALVCGGRASLLNVAFVVLVLVSFVNEDTLETLAGVMLVVFWGSLLYVERVRKNHNLK